MQRIQKKDKVRVITGSSKGQEGKVLEVCLKTERVQIEGVHMIKKHLKNQADEKMNGINEVPGFIHISNVVLIDPKDPASRSKIGYKLNKQGQKVRYNKRTGTIFDPKTRPKVKSK